ncbi:MAG: glucoamylase [bacterium]
MSREDFETPYGDGGLDEQLSLHLDFIEQCGAEDAGGRQVLLATPPENRYPYVYPRDCSCAAQLFRRLAGSKAAYTAGPRAYLLLEDMAAFIREVQGPDGSWGQRYGLDRTSKAIYVQEDNVAHGISILCSYLLTALRLDEEPEDLEGCLDAVNRGLEHALDRVYDREIDLFRSTTSLHESALESGYTLWVNLSFLFAFSLADEVDRKMDAGDRIDPRHLEFRERFLYTVNELFMDGDRYVRRIEPDGHTDDRPDVSLLSPYYYGFLHYPDELRKSVGRMTKQLWDPELGMVQRYLPFKDDPAVHIHAGSGPWMNYTAMLAQFCYWDEQRERGDELLETIDRYRAEEGAIPEHLSTCGRFESFMGEEWQTGVDFEKEFDEGILIPGIPFDLILEEAGHMRDSYHAIDDGFRHEDPEAAEGGYTQFAAPLMWSHAEYARALMTRAGDWWKLWDRE